MAISEHPAVGTILTCDFDQGFREPEMVKLRPVVVISPKIATRFGLCTVVALSTTAPEKLMPYHCQIDIAPPLPKGLASQGVWVKGDMGDAVGLHRLDLIRMGKDLAGKRIYRWETLSDEQLKMVRACVLRALGMSALTKHL